MLAIVAAAIFFLSGFHVIEDTVDVTWWLIGLALLALHFVVEIFWPTTRWRRP